MSKGYKSYKPRLRVEFLYRCAYCETREPEIGGSESYHIDHYKPKKQFPNLINAYENLIYSCRDCNIYKGDYWPSLVQEILGKVILNPRIDNSDEHIDMSKYVWIGITSRGKWTVEKLRLDSLVLSQRREDRQRIEKKIIEFNEMVENAKKELEIAKKNNLWIKCQELENFIKEETKTIESFKRKISGPMD